MITWKIASDYQKNLEALPGIVSDYLDVWKLPGTFCDYLVLFRLIILYFRVIIWYSSSVTWNFRAIICNSLSDCQELFFERLPGIFCDYLDLGNYLHCDNLEVVEWSLFEWSHEIFDWLSVTFWRITWNFLSDHLELFKWLLALWLSESFLSY